MNRKEELEKQIRELSGELREIIDREDDEERKQYAGKCYKYRNSYGSLSVENWWCYSRVDSTGKREFCFEVDCYGKAMFDINYNFNRPVGGSIEIPLEEFKSEWKKMRDLANKQLEEINGQ